MQKIIRIIKYGHLPLYEIQDERPLHGLCGSYAARINITPELQLTKKQLLDAILKEMSHQGFTDTDADDFWDDMMDLRKAKNIR